MSETRNPAGMPQPSHDEPSQHADAPHDEMAADAQPAANELQALRISKALEQASANRPVSESLFPAPASQDAASDGVAPAPTNSDALRGGGKAALISRPKRRRSASVTFAKVALPMVAIVTLGYLFYWWYIHNREAVINVAAPDKPSTSAPVVTVNNFKYSATDSQNRPYTITADSATQPQDKTIDTITLVRPQANFTLAGNHWMTITAQNGQYHRNADLVDLDGDVTMFHDTGMSFHTSHAQIDMKAKIAAGQQPVQGQNATSDISAEGFRILDNGDTVIFTGKTLLKLHSKGKDGTQ